MSNKPRKVSFLADESLRKPTILLLKDLGYPVTTADEAGLAGKPDIDVLRAAIRLNKILVTEDLDFGNILLYPTNLHHGVLLLRFRHALTEAIHHTLIKLLKDLKPSQFTKTLLIVDDQKYRIRREK